MSVTFFYIPLVLEKLPSWGYDWAVGFICHDDVCKIRTAEWVRWFSFARSSFHGFPQFVQHCSIPDWDYDSRLVLFDAVAFCVVLWLLQCACAFGSFVLICDYGSVLALVYNSWLWKCACFLAFCAAAWWWVHAGILIFFLLIHDFGSVLLLWHFVLIHDFGSALVFWHFALICDFWSVLVFAFICAVWWLWLCVCTFIFCADLWLWLWVWQVCLYFVCVLLIMSFHPFVLVVVVSVLWPKSGHVGFLCVWEFFFCALVTPFLPSQTCCNQSDRTNER